MKNKLLGYWSAGDRSPEMLFMNTVFYYIGQCFALHGGDEHRHLQHDPGQIQLHEQQGIPSFLV